MLPTLSSTSRLEKVFAIRHAIQNGTYSINSEQIAEALIRRAAAAISDLDCSSSLQVFGYARDPRINSS